jgi:hypothetical protein
MPQRALSVGLRERGHLGAHYAVCLEASRKARWDIDADVLRGRECDFRDKFLPASLSRAAELGFLSEAEQRTLSHVQGRTYAYLFGLMDRFIGARMLEQSRQHWFGDPVAFEALVRFSEAEERHQELFRRVEALTAHGMPEGYATVVDPDDVVHAVLSMSSWAVLAMTCHIGLIAQSHYEQSLDADAGVSPLFRDVFRYHWQEECQHAVLAELEWRRVNVSMAFTARDRGVTDLVELIGVVDGVVQAQAAADSAYFLRLCNRRFSEPAQRAVRSLVLRAYRWQFILSGIEHAHFNRLITALTTRTQLKRIQLALMPILND